MRKIPVFAVVFLVSLFGPNAYAQNFSFGWDFPLVGVAGDSQAAVGTGLNVGLVQQGPIRIGVGFGVVYYPGRPVIKIVDNRYPVYVVDNLDLTFNVSTGFRFREVGDEFPAWYFTISYIRAVTAKNLPGLGKVNNGVLMGLTLSSR